MLNCCFSSTVTNLPIFSSLPLKAKTPSSLPTAPTTKSSTLFPSKASHRHLQLFLNALTPDNLTLRSVLKHCIKSNNYPFALQCHALIVKLHGSCTSDLITNTCLINLYSEFGLIQLARDVFDKIALRDVVAFTSMMLCYNRVGEYEEALRVFKRMIENDGLSPNGFAFTCVLSALAGLSSIFTGQQIHAQVLKSSLQSDVFVGTALVNMYNNYGRIDCARKAFFSISQPNVVSWNAIMAGKFGGEEVMELFMMLLESGVSPDPVTFATLLRSCKDISLFSVRQIHGMVLKMIGSEVDVFIGTSLFDIYIDDDCTTDAKKVFESICEKDVAAFNLAIRGYKRKGHEEYAFNMFCEATKIGMELNEATLTSLLVNVKGLRHGKQLHALVTKLGFDGNVSSIATSLVVMYSQFHCLDDAELLFEKTHAPDLILWTSMISSFSQNGKHQEALKFYNLMLLEASEAGAPNHYTFSSVLCSCASLAAVEEGKQIHAQIVKSNRSISSDIFVSSGLIDMYSKCGYITEAKCLFDNTKHDLDLAAWNVMITGLAQHGLAQAAIELFEELLNLTSLVPNDITYLGILFACSHSGLVAEGYKYFKQIKQPSLSHYACFIDLLGRAGRLEEAMNVIKEMPYDPNEIIWSSLLAASVVHGEVEVGEFSAANLVKLNPRDPGTYIALSNVYASAGRWEDVMRVRKLMDDLGLRKDPGFSWLQVEGRTQAFIAAGCRNGKNALASMHRASCTV